MQKKNVCLVYETIMSMLIYETIMKMFVSYLSDRRQRVIVNDKNLTLATCYLWGPRRVAFSSSSLFPFY